MNVKNVSFGADKVWQPELPLRFTIPQDKKKELMRHTIEAEQAYDSFFHSKSPLSARRAIKKANASLDEAIKNAPEGVFLRLPKLNGEPFDTQKLLGLKARAQLVQDEFYHMHEYDFNGKYTRRRMAVKKDAEDGFEDAIKTATGKNGKKCDITDLMWKKGNYNTYNTIFKKVINLNPNTELAKKLEDTFDYITY